MIRRPPSSPLFPYTTLFRSGGLGHEVSPLLRTAALPGASALLALVAHERVLDALDAGGERLRAAGRGKGVYLQAVARALRSGAHTAELQSQSKLVFRLLLEQ